MAGLRTPYTDGDIGLGADREKDKRILGESMVANPKSIVRDAPMSAFQITIVGLCVLIAALDGFDVLAIAYTAPSIAHEWGLSPTNLGVVFSAGPLGMALGAALITPIADRLGRRPVVLCSLVILAIGMLAAAFASDLTELSV